MSGRVKHLRVVVEVEDHERAVVFFRDVLGLPEQAAFEADGGARLVAAPRETPWSSLNSRLDAPGDLHVTVFQELLPVEQRQQLDGFGTDAERRTAPE